MLKKERKKSVTGNLDTQDIHFTLKKNVFYLFNLSNIYTKQYKM